MVAMPPGKPSVGFTEGLGEESSTWSNGYEKALLKGLLRCVQSAAYGIKWIRVTAETGMGGASGGCKTNCISGVDQGTGWKCSRPLKTFDGSDVNGKLAVKSNDR